MGVTVDRRDFIKVISTAGSGLVLGLYLPSTNKLIGKPVATTLFEPNVWITVQPDNLVKILVAKSEMGQGVLTSLPMIIAEEMDLDFSKVVIEKAPANKKKYGWQMTGGSNSVSGGYKKLRKAGATAREMLVMAASDEWGVSTSECKTQNGIVINKRTGKELSYGDLAEKASQQKVPKKPVLKDKKDFSIIGQNIKRTDTFSKVNGTAQFGMDVQLEGMVYATVIHSPVFGGKLKSYNKASVSDISDIIKIFEIESGLAIVTKNTWAGLKASKQIKIKWDEGDAAGLDDEKIRKDLIEASKEKGSVVRKEGNVKNALKSSNNIIKALYESPLQAHATMEPMNCTAYVQRDKCEVWAGTQDPNGARKIATKITGLSKKQVEVNVTFLGGGFGRRAFNDYVSEAVEISNEMKKPVKMIWSREEDMQHDYYRPSSVHVMVGAFDQNNNITTFKHRIVAPSILFTQIVKMPFHFKEKADIIAVEGAKHLPYEIPNMQVDYQMTETPIPLGWWRSVYNSQNAFATECFMDELAEKAGKDPVQFRLDLLPNSSRDVGVIKMVVEKSGWYDFQNGSTYQGISCHKSFGTWVAQVARVSIENKKVKVHEVFAAVDCGTVINPAIVKAQISSAIIFGLSATLKSKITMKNGRVTQSNFDDFEVLRMNESPKIHVYLAENDKAPKGVGEPGLPPIAPAVVNAVYAATGNRIRNLPIQLG